MGQGKEVDEMMEGMNGMREGAGGLRKEVGGMREGVGRIKGRGGKRRLDDRGGGEWMG